MIRLNQSRKIYSYIKFEKLKKEFKLTYIITLRKRFIINENMNSQNVIEILFKN